MMWIKSVARITALVMLIGGAANGTAHFISVLGGGTAGAAGGVLLSIAWVLVGVLTIAGLRSFDSWGAFAAIANIVVVCLAGVMLVKEFERPQIDQTGAIVSSCLMLIALVHVIALVLPERSMAKPR
jgi:hypothetical protein